MPKVRDFEYHHFAHVYCRVYSQDPTLNPAYEPGLLHHPCLIVGWSVSLSQGGFCLGECSALAMAMSAHGHGFGCARALGDERRAT